MSIENWSSPFWSASLLGTCDKDKIVSGGWKKFADKSLLGTSMWFSNFCSFLPKSDVTPAENECNDFNAKQLRSSHLNVNFLLHTFAGQWGLFISCDYVVECHYAFVQ